MFMCVYLYICSYIYACIYICALLLLCKILLHILFLHKFFIQLCIMRYFHAYNFSDYIINLFLSYRYIMV